jgi:hypothetical protein
MKYQTVFSIICFNSIHRVLTCIKWWIQNHWHDFAINHELLMLLNEFLTDIAESSDDPKLKEVEKSLRVLMTAKVKKLIHLFKIL